MISLAKVKRSANKGGVLYMAYVTPLVPTKLEMGDVDIIKEYTNVFPDELSGLPPDRQI